MCDLVSRVLKRFKTKHTEPKRRGDWGWLQPELQRRILAHYMHIPDELDEDFNSYVGTQRVINDANLHFHELSCVSKGFRAMTTTCRAAEIARLSSGYSPFIESKDSGWIAYTTAKYAAGAICNTAIHSQDVDYKNRPCKKTWQGTELIAHVNLNHMRITHATGHKHLITVRYGVPEPGSYPPTTHVTPTPVRAVVPPRHLDALCAAASRVPACHAVLGAAVVVATTGPVAIPMTLLAGGALVTGAMVVDVAGMVLRVGQHGLDHALAATVYATYGPAGHQALTLWREWAGPPRNQTPQASAADEPADPLMHYADVVVVEVPPLLLAPVPVEARTTAQQLEFEQCETALHRALCRAVHVSAHSLSLRVGSERLIQ